MSTFSRMPFGVCSLVLLCLYQSCTTTEMGRISPPSLDLILAGRLPKRPSSSPNSTPAAGDGSGLQETGEAEPSSEDPQDISPDKAQAAEAGGAELDGSKKEEECAGTGAPTGGEADGAPTQEPAPASSSLLPQPISERTDGAGSLPGGTGKDAVKSATARATVDRSAAVLGGHGNQGAGCAVGSDSHLADEESEGAEGTGETAVPAAISMGANVEGSKMGGGASATVQREVLIERCFVQALETLTPDKLPCEVSAFHSQVCWRKQKWEQGGMGRSSLRVFCANSLPTFFLRPLHLAQYLLPILRAAGVDFAGTRWKKPATFFSAMLRRGLWHLSGLPSSSKRGGSSWRVATVVRTHPDYLAQLGDGEGNSSSRARHAAAVEEKGKKPEESSKEEMDAPRDSIEKSSDGNEEEASDSGGEEGEEQDRESDDEDDKGDEDEDRSESRGSEVASSRKAGNGAPSGSVATAADPKKKPSPPTIRVVELFRPTAVTTPLFATALADPALAAQVVAVGARGAPLPPGVELPADVYTKEQVLTLLKRYCEARSLDAVAHGQPVPLDDALVAALYRSTKKALIPAASPLRALAERLLGCLQPFYFLIPPKQQSDAAKEPAGDGVPAPSGEATGAIPGAAAAPAVVSARLFQGRLAPVSIEVVRRQVCNRKLMPH